ncbi:exonuclease SbcD [Motilibacter peucedani]|uniref:Nuclease SbcCD subunit D n=1 Tax=Motilibacter peucedani TaxID=598650 RepID=A0A420XSP0_9ACTN|nr:exonuclease SbcCD subunit D [Motilibacter peucedani]RKS77898.1 exonuclease SbcD [Motilibacter peucedani]
MRILHTSDWHLGRSFHREGMLGAQAAFVDFLVEVVVRERVDVVLVAGDVYDRALPAVDAVALFDDALSRLVAAGARVVLLSGNHDSASRLGFGSRLLDAAGVHLRTDPRAVGTPVLLQDDHGPVALYPLPYLEPDAAGPLLACDERGHAAVLGAAMRLVRADLSRRRGTRSVVAAHAFVSGGLPSDSERDISVGGIGAVTASVFDGVDYAALGHLHGPQQLGPAVRYSGSPLAYSFSEARHTKSVALVELGASGLGSVEVVPCPVPRPLATLRGSLDDLLTGAQHAHLEDSWLQVTLTDAVRPREPMERLRARFPHVLVLGFDPVGGPQRAQGYSELVRGLDDLGLAAGFVEHVRAGAAPTDAETALLREAFEAVRLREAVA